MLQNVCTFCRNCDKCHMNNSWKNHWQSFLKSLPVSERIWQKIFIDFIVNLSSNKSCTNLLMITDCFSKRVILKLCKEMTAEWVTQIFVQYFYWAHELFTTIVSDWENSVCEQPVKKNLSVIEDWIKNVHSLSVMSLQWDWRSIDNI